MPTNMQTVTTSTDYHVGASDQLVFTDQPAFRLSQPIVSGTWASPSPHLSISGEVDVVMTSPSAAGSSGMSGIVITNTLDSSPSVSLDAGAILKVTVSGGSAIGYFGGGSAPPTFTNAGAVVVSADGQAQGLLNGVNKGLLINSGQVTVTSISSDATGLKTGGYGVQVLNSGSITVTGHGQVIGVDMGASGTQEVFDNTGTIVAHDDSTAQTSIGVAWNDGPQPGLEGRFVNDGTIEADRALEVEISYGTAAENLITNNGRMVGAVWLGGGAAVTLLNNGVIDGSIHMIGAGSLYDGRLGAALGPIVGGNNGGDTFLGGAGPETMTGGLSNDTISGGGGDDRIDGGDGANQLDGGAGTNILSFASVHGGIQLDLGAGTARLPTGSDTLTGFAQVVGSSYDDLMTGSSGDDSLDGSQGNDTLAGGAGQNVLFGGDGNDSISGGGDFNRVNGNKGDDTIVGGSRSGDWLSGGQGNDLIDASHSTGRNIINGNIGNDTLSGANFGDTLRGGQGDDVIHGGTGGDLIFGDLGNNTLTGGAGADTFHNGAGAAQDVITDFRQSDGDHVQISAGLTYATSQVDADVHVSVSNGDVIILQNTQLSSLAAGWITSG